MSERESSSGGRTPGLLLDANLPGAVSDVLRDAGLTVVEASAQFPPATSDDEVIAYAKQHGLILLTRDGDFADIRRYPPEQHAGIVVLILPTHATRSIIVQSVQRLLQARDVFANATGRLVIAERDRLRIRPAI